MKKKILLLLSVLIINIFAFNTSTFAESFSDTTAKSAILIEQSTGQVLYQENPSEKLQASSLNKIMSMLLWAEDIEQGKYTLDDTVTASINAENAKGSSIWLVSGDKVSVLEIFKSVAIANANDATIAMAEFSAGSESEFVKLMNSRASELGMNNTKFVNSTGISASGQHTTAHDIAIATRELFTHDIYNEFMLIQLDYVRDGKAQLVNTNKMIRTYKGILGGKASDDEKTGSCLSVVAKKGEMTLIAVVLGDKDKDSAVDYATRMLDHCFGSFEVFKPVVDSSKLVPVSVRGGVKKNIDVKVANSGYSIIPKSKADDIEYKYSLIDEVQAPISQNHQVGVFRVYLDGEVIFQSDIICSEIVEELDFFKGVLMLLKSLFNV